MTNSGKAVLPNISESGFVINQDILTLLQSDETLWKNFLSFTPLYRRVRIDTIQFNKHRPALYRSRLDKFIENTRALCTEIRTIVEDCSIIEYRDNNLRRRAYG